MSLPISGAGSGESGKAGEGGVPAVQRAKRYVHRRMPGRTSGRPRCDGVLLQQPAKLGAVDFAALLDRELAHGVQQIG